MPLDGVLQNISLTPPHLDKNAVWLHNCNKPNKPQPRDGVSGGDGAGKPFSPKDKDKIREDDNNTCVFCGEETTNKPGPTRSEIDHADPKSRGGNNSLANGQNTCRTCNREKGSKTTQEYLDYRSRK